MLRTVLAISLIFTAGVSGAAEFRRIEGLSGSPFPRLSRDGLLFVSQARTQAAIWTVEGGVERIPLPDGYSNVRVEGMSGDGRTIAGSAGRSGGFRDGFIWSRDGGYQIIDQSLHADRKTQALDVSENQTVVGWFEPSSDSSDWEAFVWTADGGLVPLGDLPGGLHTSKANAISDDASVIVGEANAGDHDEQEPVIWRGDGSMIRIADGLTPGALGRAYAVSSDGKHVVGTLFWEEEGGGAFRWSENEGVEFLGVYGSALAVSDDGTVIAGVDNAYSGATLGFIWNEGLGSRQVSKVLVHDHGIPESVGDFGGVYALSGDGTVVLGRFGRDGDYGWYWARLTDDALPGDVNFDDRVDLDDFATLRKGFGKGIYRDQGDTNLDRRVDLTDFGILKVNLGNVREASVPEPASLALLASGFVLLVAARIRRP